MTAIEHFVHLPSSAQQQREMAAYFWFIYFELDAGVRYLAWASSTHFEQTETIVKFEGKILIQFYWTLSSGSRSLLLKFSIMILDRFLD